MEDKLREMLRELGRALAESSDASQALRRLHEEGYSLYMLLDRSGNVAVPAGASSEVTTCENAESAVPRSAIVEPVFRIDGQDLRFLRSLGIDPTRRIRRRGRNPAP